MAFQGADSRWQPATAQEGLGFVQALRRGKGHAPFTWKDGITYQCPVKLGVVRSSAGRAGSDKPKPKVFCPVPNCQHKGAASFGWLAGHFEEKHLVRRLAARSVALARRLTSARACSRVQMPGGGAAPTAPTTTEVRVAPLFGAVSSRFSCGAQEDDGSFRSSRRSLASTAARPAARHSPHCRAIPIRGRRCRRCLPGRRALSPPSPASSAPHAPPRLAQSGRPAPQSEWELTRNGCSGSRRRRLVVTATSSQRRRSRLPLP